MNPTIQFAFAEVAKLIAAGEDVGNAYAVREIVRQYGGGTNTQVAAILVASAKAHPYSREQVAATFGEDIARLYGKVADRYRADRMTEILDTCCQGVAVIVLALELARWLEIFRAGPTPDEAGMRAGNNAITVAANNSRVRTASEYPELRTDRLLDELGEVFEAVYQNYRTISGKINW